MTIRLSAAMATMLVQFALPLQAEAQSSKAEMAPLFPPSGDIPATFKPVLGNFDYVRREVMIPMRDGKKLHTVIIVPKAVARGPIMLDRTPYSASEATARRSGGTVVEDLLRPAYAELARAG